MTHPIRHLFLTLALFFCALPLFAQLSIEFERNNENYLQYEPVYTRVTIKNLSGHPLLFTDSGRLAVNYNIVVEDAHGHVLPFNRSKALPFTPFVLQPNGINQVVIPLSRYVDLRQTGLYRAKVIVHHPRLPTAYESNWIAFSIVNGTVVWKGKLGVYTLADETDTSKIESRDISILTLFNGDALAYYYRMEDDHKVYALRRICRQFNAADVIKSANDEQNTTHFLIHVSRRLYLLTSYDTDGKCTRREVYICELETRHPYLDYASPIEREIVVKNARAATKEEYIDDGFNIAEIRKTDSYQP